MAKAMLLDRPIEIGGFVLSQYGAQPYSDKVRPTQPGWRAAMSFVRATEIANPYWCADLLFWLFDVSRWDSEAIDQLIAETGWERQTVASYKWAATHVAREARPHAPSFAHARVVAGLSPKQQVAVLKRAKTEELTVHQTRKAVRRLTRPRVVEAQAALTGQYRVILADPPWTYDNDSTRDDGSLSGAASSYEGLTIEDLCALPVKAHSQKNSVLFLWTTASHLYDNPGPREVIEAWGFEPKTGYVWDKVLGMPGHYSYVQHEHLLVATRGSCTPDVDILQHDHASIFVERRQGEHSEKPAFARKLITSLYPDGARVELFARQPTPGWATFGNDARLWQKGA